MTCQPVYAPSVSVELAQELLAAWISRDDRTLRAKLEKTLSVSVEVTSSHELERLELLLGLAERLKGCPDRFSLPGDNPALDLWLGLLRNLAEQSGI